MTDNRRRLPNDSVLTDDKLDRGNTIFAPMGPGPGSIVGELIARSGNPEAGTLVPRQGTDGLCETCLGSPDEPAPAKGHPYHPIVNRVPGLHASIDDPGRAPRNTADGGLAEGEQLLDVDDPDLAPGGPAEQKFFEKAARHREGVWPRPAVLIDRNAVRNGYGPGVIRVDY
jgi:hypothetical protein